MTRLKKIRAGTPKEAHRDSGEWVFIDLGFSEKAKSCGLLIGGNKKPEEISFSQLKERLLKIVASNNPNPLNLLIEAPLSVAFNQDGNPTGRSIEKRGSQSRYWYVGPGCSVLVSATYLLRAVYDSHPRRKIRLFEGLASFKPKGEHSSHSNDVLNLRKVIWDSSSKSGRIVPGKKLAVSKKHRLLSAFLVAGMDFGVPAAIVLDD